MTAQGGIDRAIDDLGAAIEQAITAPAVARHVAHTEVRSWLRPILVGVAVVALLVSLPIAVLWAQIGQLSEGQLRIIAQQAADQQDREKLAEQARQAGVAADRANAQLASRGQATVPIPPVGRGERTDSEVLVAAAAAQVLASLPPPVAGAAGAPGAPGAAVTAEKVATALAQYLAANPPGPSPTQIAAAVADYLVAHPPPGGATGSPGPPGPPGPGGATGPPPTAEQIAGAFRVEVARDPALLCPLGGQFRQVTVVTSSGAIPAWLCVDGQAELEPPPDDNGPLLPGG